MTGVPSIYGDLTPETSASYSRWIMALFDLTEHVSWCKAGCRDVDYRCPVGRVLDAEEQSAWAYWKEARRGRLMTGVPSIYGDLTPETSASYSRWIMALFDLTEHVSWCKAGCRDVDYRCPVGRVLDAEEQSAWAYWKEARRG